jgi:hypothetical protein
MDGSIKYTHTKHTYTQDNTYTQDTSELPKIPQNAIFGLLLFTPIALEIIRNLACYYSLFPK